MSTRLSTGSTQTATDTLYWTRHVVNVVRSSPLVFRREKAFSFFSASSVFSSSCGPQRCYYVLLPTIYRARAGKRTLVLHHARNNISPLLHAFLHSPGLVLLAGPPRSSTHSTLRSTPTLFPVAKRRILSLGTSLTASSPGFLQRSGRVQRRVVGLEDLFFNHSSQKVASHCNV